MYLPIQGRFAVRSYGHYKGGLAILGKSLREPYLLAMLDRITEIIAKFWGRAGLLIAGTAEEVGSRGSCCTLGCGSMES